MPGNVTPQGEVRLRSSDELRSLYLNPAGVDSTYLARVEAELRRRDGQAFAALAARKKAKGEIYELAPMRLSVGEGTCVHRLLSPVRLHLKDDLSVSLTVGHDPKGTLLVTALLCAGAFLLSHGALGVAVAPAFVALFFSIRSLRRKSKELSLTAVRRIMRDRSRGNIAVLASLDGREGWFGLSCEGVLDKVVDRLAHEGEPVIEEARVCDPLGMPAGLFWSAVAVFVALLYFVYQFLA